MKEAGMNPIEHDDANDTALPEELRRSLQSMRHEVAPERDLWSGIATRIGPARTASPPRLSGSHRNRRPRRLLRFATAASFAVVLVVAWKLVPQPAPTSNHQAGLMLHEAKAMTREYQAAWRTLDAQRHPDVDATALQQLDRSAAEVRAALRQDPDARFLFNRLQSVYARRLDLSRRLVAPATSST